ncbi:bcl-2-like protein 11 isoform X2 [Narcine bancroftii]|uniref:bcl-2-like protein 11 isoform X2 n=1 Tax=Narcine bancroftii TaxID=1343680 RepID=UPI003831B91F
MTMPMGHNQSTQTPSLACQAIHHAQHTLAQVQRLLNSGPQHVQIQGSSESLPMDVPIELWIGQELRRIGDEFVSIRIQEGCGCCREGAEEISMDATWIGERVIQG